MAPASGSEMEGVKGLALIKASRAEPLDSSDPLGAFGADKSLLSGASTGGAGGTRLEIGERAGPAEALAIGAGAESA